MSCYRTPAKENCFEPVSLQRACGHVWKTTCWEVSSVEDSVCRVMTKKQLPCGHWVRGECSGSVEKIVCKEPVEHTLGCRHTVQCLCGDSLEKRLTLTCSVSEMVTLPCGHLYRLQCGSKESEKPLDKIYCRYYLTKNLQVMKQLIYPIFQNRKLVEKENKCGHKITAECGKNLSKKDCTFMCEKMLDCGHQCPLLCQEPCTTEACKHQVELNSITLSCGHPLKGECNLRYAGIAFILFHFTLIFKRCIYFQTKMWLKQRNWRWENVILVVQQNWFVVIVVRHAATNVHPISFIPSAISPAKICWFAGTSTWFFFYFVVLFY